MSEPREPRFEDDFDCDTEPADQYYQPVQYTIDEIAQTKGWKYSLGYDKITGMVSPKPNSSELKEAYKAGFLEGFAYRLTEPTPDTGE